MTETLISSSPRWPSGPRASTTPDNPKAQAFLFYGDGKGHFRKTIFKTGMGFHEARVADLNGDGMPDILSKPYNWETPRLDIWLNQEVKRPATSAGRSVRLSRENGWVDSRRAP